MSIIICLFASAGYDRAAQGMAGAGRQLADQFGVGLHAIIIGATNEAMISSVAAVVDAITMADQPELAEYQPELYLTALTQVCREIAPRAVLLSNDFYSQELAPRLAHRLSGSAAGDGVELTVHDGAVRVTRAVYGGKAQAVIELKRISRI